MTEHEIEPEELAQHARESEARFGDVVAGLGTLYGLLRKYPDQARGDTMDDVIARMSPTDRAAANAIRGQLAEFKARRTREGW